MITYLYTENNKNWKSFNTEINVPLGDQLARVALSKNLNDSIAKSGFRAGRNKEADLDDLIWVIKNFNSLPFLKKAIYEWKKADELVNQLYKIGHKVDLEIKSRKLDEQSRHKLSYQISTLCDKLDRTADKFSNIVGDGTREIKDNLIVINIFIIMIIISIYYTITLKKK